MNKRRRRQTSEEQIYTERTIWPLLVNFGVPEHDEDAKKELIEEGFCTEDGKILLMRRKHLMYLAKGLRRLSAGHVCLDASRPWLIYWISHSLCLLGIDFFDDSSKEMASRIVDTIGRCVSKDTTCGEGVGGGPQQLPHLAPTYAATLALCTVGTEDALKLLNRSELYKWFMSLKNKDGSFAIHRDGESDIRSSYLLLAVAKILNILTPELAQGAANFVNKCQSMMGGFGGEPGNEGHGGYAFNGVASLAILDRLDLLRVSHFDRWLCNSQMRLEGGFQGRKNKLVDGCYSFWQGGTPAILKMCMKSNGITRPYLPDAEALQRYILHACQQRNGGLRDKPSKPRDFYHTCYCLSGLSVAQHYGGGAIVGDSDANRIGRTHALFNVRHDMVSKALKYYSKLPCTHKELMAGAK